jgi:hypothetical protein
MLETSGKAESETSENSVAKSYCDFGNDRNHDGIGFHDVHLLVSSAMGAFASVTGLTCAREQGHPVKNVLALVQIA